MHDSTGCAGSTWQAKRTAGPHPASAQKVRPPSAIRESRVQGLGLNTFTLNTQAARLHRWTAAWIWSLQPASELTSWIGLHGRCHAVAMRQQRCSLACRLQGSFIVAPVLAKHLSKGSKGHIGGTNWDQSFAVMLGDLGLQPDCEGTGCGERAVSEMACTQLGRASHQDAVLLSITCLSGCSNHAGWPVSMQLCCQGTSSGRFLLVNLYGGAKALAMRADRLSLASDVSFSSRSDAGCSAPSSCDRCRCGSQSRDHYERCCSVPGVKSGGFATHPCWPSA